MLVVLLGVDEVEDVVDVNKRGSLRNISGPLWVIRELSLRHT